MEKISDVLIKDSDFGICGCYNGGDSIHVGIYWKQGGEQKVIHFRRSNYIPLQNLDNYFLDYLFNPINDFEKELIPSLAAVSELISENKINGFIFNKEQVIYNGGKFGFFLGDYQTSTQIEKIVNCGVFVTALLHTMDYVLLDWDSWPQSSDGSAYLDLWLHKEGIPSEEFNLYYEQSKELRGKHILVAPSTLTKPSSYAEAEHLSNELINSLNPKIFPHPFKK